MTPPERLDFDAVNPVTIATRPSRPFARPIITRARAVVLIILIVLLRALIPLYWSDAFFNADQAVTGLMAKHLAEGRALPVMQYGAQYVLVLEAWLAAPLMWLDDTSTLALRAVPVVLNIAACVLLFAILTTPRSTLSPGLALLATLPVAFPSVSASLELAEPIGMNVEPLLFAVVFWLLRSRPIALGMVAAIAVKNREFALYAVASLLLVEWLRDRAMAVWRPRLAGLVAFAVTWAGIGILHHHSSPLGPGSSEAWVQPSGGNLAVVAGAFCFAPEHIPDDVTLVATELLPLQYGLRSASWGDTALSTDRPPDASWLWWPLVLVLAAGAGRGVQRAWRAGASEATWIGIYLTLIGLQAVVVYSVSRCGNASFFTLRYLLLSLLIGSGAMILALERERARLIKAVTVTVCLLWMAIVAAGHLTVARGLLRTPPLASYRALATYLDQHGVRFIASDYWTGYHVAYLTGERVRAATDFDRVLDHTLAVKAHPDEVVEVRRLPAPPCDGGVTVAAAFHVCP